MRAPHAPHTHLPAATSACGAGRKVAIDASMSLYQFLIAVRAEGAQLTSSDGETTRYSSIASCSAPSPTPSLLPPLYFSLFTSPSLLPPLYFPLFTSPSLLPPLYFPLFTSSSLLPPLYFPLFTSSSLLPPLYFLLFFSILCFPPFPTCRLFHTILFYQSPDGILLPNNPHGRKWDQANVCMQGNSVLAHPMSGTFPLTLGTLHVPNTNHPRWRIAACVM